MAQGTKRHLTKQQRKVSHFYFYFCQKMEFRTYFVYFHRVILLLNSKSNELPQSLGYLCLNRPYQSITRYIFSLYFQLYFQRCIHFCLSSLFKNIQEVEWWNFDLVNFRTNSGCVILKTVLIKVRLVASLETQGRSVRLGEKARQTFSSTGGKAPGYRLSPDHF